MSTDDWLTSAQVARMLGYTVKTLDNWAAMTPRKGPPFARPEGGQRRYRMGDVRDWQAAQYQ